MDNFTHSVVGLAVGELLQRSLAPEPESASQHMRRRLLLFACWAASNFPDLDLIFSPLLPAPLGYLLHHRGHTHTLLLALPQALLLAALIWLLWPSARRLLARSADARRALALAIGLGFLLHLSMDYLNSYGIHPFYPFDMRWWYGDMVFILEPLFWVAAGVPLVLMLKRRVARWALLGVVAAALLWCVHAGFLHWASLALLGLVGSALAFVQVRAQAADGRPGQGDRRGRRGRSALLAGLAACCAFVAVQGVGSARGAHVLAAELRQRDPASELLDASMTAYPANPLCWNFVTVERNAAADLYRLRRGVLSLAPGVLAVKDCPAGLTGSAQPDTGSPAIALLSDQRASLAALRQLAQENCYFRAWLRFARAPQVAGQLASDVRFGTTLASNFSTIDLAQFAGRACPANVPGWDFPRADLLRAP
ncbi:MAG: metal-dependent hydrolase [Massilia sp.]|nr:metal-dependent hydrolase [Massilia sp.]